MSLRVLTKSLILIGLLSMVLGAFLGVFLIPTQSISYTGDSENLTQVLLTKLNGSFSVTVFKILAVLVLMFPAIVMVKKIMGYESDVDLRSQMVTPDNNDSPVILTVGMGIAIAIFVSGLPFTGPFNFLAYLLFKGGYALILSVLLALFLVRFRANIKTFAEAEDEIKKEGTNAVSLLISGAAIIAAVVI